MVGGSRHDEFFNVDDSHSSRSKATQLQQEQVFHELGKDVQILVQKIAEGYTKLEDLVSKEHDMAHSAILQEPVRAEVTAQEIDAGIETRRKIFLKSLKFAEIDQRHNDLADSWRATFKKVFTTYKNMTANEDKPKAPKQAFGAKKIGTEDENNDRNQTWVGFIDWLQSDGSLFYVQGKPGSGKSTLIKFLVGNENTKKVLHRWSSDASIIAHFFWKIGSPAQNSIKGFLCALIYRMLQNDERMAEHVLQNSPSLSSMTYYSDWSAEDLSNVLYFILEKDTRHRCIFIDGLDEVCEHDGIPKLVQLIEDILRFPNNKICVTSRPEEAVLNWLKGKDAPGLILEDLTRPDMRAFVLGELKPFHSKNIVSLETHELLVEKLISKSQGVFLWLQLAVRNLATWIQDEDPEETLLSQLEELPSELDQLYADMWGRLNEDNSECRGTTARYFYYALQDKGLVPMFPEVGFPSGFPEIQLPTLFQITCADGVKTQESLLSDGFTIDLTKVRELCEETKLDIRTRCAGLLQVTTPSMRGRLMEIVQGANSLPVQKGSADVDDTLFSRVSFIHRTAHDFLMDTETGQEILKHGVLSEAEMEARLLKGLLCVLTFLHSKFGVMGRSSSIFYRIRKLWESQDRDTSEEANKMIRIVQNMYDNGVIGADFPSWQPQAPFFSHLTDYALFDDFVLSSLKEANSKQLATDVLREAWDPDLSLYYGRDRAPSLRLIDSLISMGANPHVYGINRRQEMGSMEPFVRQGTALTNLLMASMKSIDDGKHLDSDSARTMLKAAVSMAMSCPDLSATALLVVRVKKDGEASLMNTTWLNRPETFIRSEMAWLLYEVDLKFLLLRLFPDVAVDVAEDVLRSSQGVELLPRLKHPSSTIRFTLTRDDASKDIICHRISSQNSTPKLTERIFPPDALIRKAGEVKTALEKEDSVYEWVMQLTREPSAEKVDLESAMISLAKEKLGFCTLLEAGDSPTLQDVEHMEEFRKLYPGVIKELKAAISEANPA